MIRYYNETDEPHLYSWFTDDGFESTLVPAGSSYDAYTYKDLPVIVEHLGGEVEVYLEVNCLMEDYYVYFR